EENTVYEELILEVNKLKQEVCDLKYVNKELMDYIDTLEKKDSLQCQGNKFQDVGKKQQTRKLQHLRSKAECALWFCESFGLKRSNIKLKDNTGASYSLDYNSSPAGVSGLSQDDQSIIEKVLFLLDKFCVGVNHKLLVLSEDLPRSYLTKQKWSALNKTYHIEGNVWAMSWSKNKFHINPCRACETSIGTKIRATRRKHSSKVKWGWHSNDVLDKFHDVFICTFARTKCFVMQE
ncbi:Hypothetical predicted protein, partial [Paramuricea clavata]